jgi:hypothetical protein
MASTVKSVTLLRRGLKPLIMVNLNKKITYLSPLNKISLHLVLLPNQLFAFAAVVDLVVVDHVDSGVVVDLVVVVLVDVVVVVGLVALLMNVAHVVLKFPVEGKDLK